MNFLSFRLITFSCSLSGYTRFGFKMLHSQYSRVTQVSRMRSFDMIMTDTSFCNVSLLTVKIRTNIRRTTAFITLYTVKILPTVKRKQTVLMQCINTNSFC